MFPAEQFIDYGKLGLTVNENNLRHLDRLICEFHGDLSPAEFNEKQLSARKAWEDWLSPINFFGKLDIIAARHLAAMP